MLQISLVVATKSGSTLTPIPNESGEGGSGRLMALNEIVALALAAVTLMPMSLPPVIVLLIDGHVVGPEQQHRR